LLYIFLENRQLRFVVDVNKRVLFFFGELLPLEVKFRSSNFASHMRMERKRISIDQPGAWDVTDAVQHRQPLHKCFSVQAHLLYH